MLALVHYGQSLARKTLRDRVLLLTLRGLVLLLLACAVAGLGIEYESRMKPRVLVQMSSNVDGSGGMQNGEALSAQKRNAEEVVQRVMTALSEKNIEGVESGKESEAAETNTSAQPLDAGEPPLIATLLLTNGAMTASAARSEVERASASSGGAPVYVVVDEELNDAPVLVLESFEMLNRPARGVRLSVRCTIHGRGMRGHESLVTVSNAAQVEDSTRIVWTSDDERRTVPLEVVPKVAGWTNYTARVEAASGSMRDAGVTLSTDSLRSRALDVYAEERRPRVLFFEGEPTWEGKFIRRALERGEIFDVDYFAQVSRAAAIGLSEAAGAKGSAESDSTTAQGAQATDERSAKSEAAASRKANEGSLAGAKVNAPEAKLHATLASAAQLAGYDCIIVGATPDAMLSRAESVRLREWVERRGGGLIVLGGNGFAGSLCATNGKLSSLMPAEINQRGLAATSGPSSEAARERESKRGQFALTPTAAGASVALRAYLTASVEARRGHVKRAGANGVSAGGVNVLTGEGFSLEQLRAGASALAVSGAAGADGTSEAGATLIAAMRDGAGRVVAFAPADSWRLQTSANDEAGASSSSNSSGGSGGAFAALWQGLVLWSASDARAPALIVLNTDAPPVGSEVIAEINVRDAAFAPLRIERIAARLELLTDNSSAEGFGRASMPEIIFAPTATNADVWQARFTLRARGQYALIVDYIAAGKTNSAKKLFATASPLTLENGAAHDTLERLARETGGDIFAVTDARTLAARLAASTSQTQTIRRTFHLRTWWPLAFIIPLLLTTAWFFERKMMNAE